MAEDADEFLNVRDRIEHAVAAGVRDKNGLLIKFIVIADYLDEDGDRMMFSAQTSGLSKWDMLGMIEFVRCDIFGQQASNNVLADTAEDE